MKTELRFTKLLMTIALLLGIFVSSCTKEEPLLLPESEKGAVATLKNATIDDVICDLIAGQSINVGSVIYSHDATNIYVTYTTANGWTLKELHLYVGNLAGLPSNKTAVQIGHFPYTYSSINGMTSYTFEVPIIGLSHDDNVYTIAAHAVVVNGTMEETAWSNCTYEPIIMLKSYFTNGKYAVTDGTPFSTDYYCWHGGYNYYTNPDEYLLQNMEYFLPINGGAGKVNVSDDGTTLTVVVTANDGLTLDRSYLFVGTMQEFLAIQTTLGNCPDYPLFPFNEFTDGATHTFDITIPNLESNSISFESAYDSKRWGWFSYYKL